MDLPFLYHPIFQSLVLPLLLSLAGIALLRTFFGPALAAAAVGLSVLLSAIWLMGWSPRPDSLMQKLPWIFGSGWVAGVALSVTAAGRLMQWLVLTLVWLLASWWLGTSSLAFALVLAAAGAAIIACLVGSEEARADAATALVLAGLGLAGLTFAAGSLALFQLALLLAAAVGGAGLWLWPRARIRFGAAAVGVAAIALLALAQASLLLIPVRPDALAVLAAAFVAPPLLRWFWPQGRLVTAPLVAAVVAGALAAGALALQDHGAGTGSSDKSEGKPDDGYYGK